MAQTCAINFLTLVSYSASIVIGGLPRLLRLILMQAAVDLECFQEYFRAETAWCSLLVTSHKLIYRLTLLVFTYLFTL